MALSKPVSEFPETNIRTYVVGPGGTPGIWFLRMEVGARWFTSLRLLGLPYLRRDMEVISNGGFHYLSRPERDDRLPEHRIEVNQGSGIEMDERARFLLARWRAFHEIAGFLSTTRVEHPAWPLYTAEVITSGLDALWEAIGLEPPCQDPLAHFSPGVSARLSWPRPLGHQAAQEQAVL